MIKQKVYKSNGAVDSNILPGDLKGLPDDYLFISLLSLEGVV